MTLGEEVRQCWVLSKISWSVSGKWGARRGAKSTNPRTTTTVWVTRDNQAVSRQRVFQESEGFLGAMVALVGREELLVVSICPAFTWGTTE